MDNPLHDSQHLSCPATENWGHSSHLSAAARQGKGRCRAAADPSHGAAAPLWEACNCLLRDETALVSPHLAGTSHLPRKFNDRVLMCWNLEPLRFRWVLNCHLPPFGRFSFVLIIGHCSGRANVCVSGLESLSCQDTFQFWRLSWPEARGPQLEAPGRQSCGKTYLNS